MVHRKSSNRYKLSSKNQGKTGRLTPMKNQSLRQGRFSMFQVILAQLVHRDKSLTFLNRLTEKITQVKAHPFSH